MKCHLCKNHLKKRDRNRARVDLTLHPPILGMVWPGTKVSLCVGCEPVYRVTVRLITSKG
jgi:hypothetical protein